MTFQSAQPIKIRQSQLASFSRCAMQVSLERLAAQQGRRELVLSATAFGTVIHHAAQVLEELHHEGRTDAGDVAVATFEHYWDPAHIEQLVPGGIDEWLPRQNYGGLLIRGRNNLRTYYAALQADPGHLLALEHTFTVPIIPTVPQSDTYPLGEYHELTGTVDRLALRINRKRPYLSIEDFKSGQKPTYLRHAIQFTAYSWASLAPEFWAAWPTDQLQLIQEPLHRRGFALYHDGSGLPIIPRRGRWISLRETFGVHDAGWRNPQDFTRLHDAVGQYIAALRADVYPLTVSGQTCTYCPFAYSGECGAVPVHNTEDGEPYPG